MKKLITLIIVVLISSTAVQAQNGEKKVSPPNGMSEVSAYSLFYTGYKNENYEEAHKYGLWILKNMPRTIEGYAKFNLPTNLDRLITTYNELAKQESDPSLKAAYIDTANIIYDKVFTNFSKDEIDYYQWYVNRGLFYYTNADFIDNATAKVTADYQKAFELKPEELTKVSNGYYLHVLLQNLVAEGTEESKQQALAIIKKAEPNADEELNDYFDKIRNKLFDSPEERITFLKEKVQKNPDDQDALRQLRNLYQRQDNLVEVQKLNKKLYELDPSYQNTTALANFAIQNAEYDNAIKYLNEAKTKTDDNEKLKTIYLNLSKSYSNQENFRQARSNARKAINIDSNLGQAYIIIADVYAKTVSKCSGSELKKNDRAVYWLVLDYLNKAKRVDSSVSSTANNRLRSYRQYTPTKEEIFLKNDWEKGKSIRIDSSLGSCYGWINESTTVR